MLAGGAAGIAALVLRWRQRLKTSVAEIALLALGLVLPTAMFTAWFARVESWKAAFIDASRMRGGSCSSRQPNLRFRATTNTLGPQDFPVFACRTNELKEPLSLSR